MLVATISLSSLLHFWQLLTKIHPTIGAALIVLLGTIVTLWLNRVEQRRQQLIDLRRDVYLSASDTLASVLEAMNTLADRSIPLAKMSEFMQRFAGHVGKLHLLGNSETVGAVIAFQRVYLEEYFRRAQLKVRLDVTVGDLQAVTQEMARLQERRFALARFWEATRIASQQGSPPQEINERLRIVQHEQEAINRDASTLERRQRELEGLSQGLEMQLFEMSPAIASALNPPLIRLTLLLRRELGLESDESYIEAMTSLTESSASRVQSFVHDYQQFLRERENRRAAADTRAETQTPLNLTPPRRE